MKKNILALALALLLTAALLAGCGRSANGGAAQSYSSSMAMAADFAPAAMEEAYEYEEAYWGDMDAPAAAAPMPDPAVPLSAEIPAEQNPAKLIYTADLSMETLDFDSAVDALAALTAQVGGYYESSTVSDQGAYRWARYTVRVPAGQYRTFLDRAGDSCHVLNLREYTEDVSEVYYDTSGRLETQKTKLARLQTLLAQAESMEDIITIESAISETEELIDRLSGALRHYDALVDYSTVDVYLEEVKVYEPEPDPTFGTRLGSAFSDGLRGFGEGLGNLLVALAYSWLWLLLIAAIVVLVLWLTRRRRAARREERAQRKARAAARDREPVRYTLPTEEPKE